MDVLSKQAFSAATRFTPGGLPAVLENGDLVQLGVATVRKLSGRIFINDPQPMSSILPQSSSLTSYGILGLAATGTFSAGALSTTSLGVSLMHTVLGTAAAAGSLAGITTSKGHVVRGNAAGIGGYAILHRFSMETLQTGQRGFFGQIDGNNGTVLSNIDPTTSTALGKVGVGFNTNAGNWRLINNTAGSAPTSTDLGANFPINTTDVLSLLLWADANSSSVGYLVSNESTGTSVSGALSTNLPANTVFQNPIFWWTNNATAATVRARIYGSAVVGGF